MSDQGITISAEDRERLAKSKFGEWFDEFFEKKFEEAFEKKQATRKPGQPTAHPANGDADTSSKPQQPARRRSLLEECFSQTFGF